MWLPSRYDRCGWLECRRLIIAGVGGGLGMFGVFKQTNAYFPFRPGQFLEHLFRVGRAHILKGRSEAAKQVHAAAQLGEGRGEDRNQSLIGLYWVFCGFFSN